MTSTRVEVTNKTGLPPTLKIAGTSVPIHAAGDSSVWYFDVDDALLGGGGGPATVTTASPISGDGSGGAPVDLALAANPGLEDSSGLRIKIDPAGIASRTASGLLVPASTAVGVVEDFTRANENPVGAGSVGRAPYTCVFTGVWQIASGELKCNSVAENHIVWDVGCLEYVATLTIGSALPTSGGLIFTYSSIANNNTELGWLINRGAEHGGNWTVFQRANGGFNEYGGNGNTGIASAPGDVVKVTVDPIRFVVNVNGVDGFTGQTGLVHPSPFVGIREAASAVGRYTHLTVVPA